jgi:antitoxin ParD1/3/4
MIGLSIVTVEANIMNVHLTPELEQIVHSKVESGNYSSASEVVREALRLMNERDQLKAIQREEFQKKISAGLESARTGRLLDGEEVFARLEAELDAIESKSKK